MYAYRPLLIWLGRRLVNVYSQTYIPILPRKPVMQSFFIHRAQQGNVAKVMIRERSYPDLSIIQRIRPVKPMSGTLQKTRHHKEHLAAPCTPVWQLQEATVPHKYHEKTDALHTRKGMIVPTTARHTFSFSFKPRGMCHPCPRVGYILLSRDFPVSICSKFGR